MARYAMVRTSTGKVENLVEWSGDTTKWQPPADCTMVQSDTANLGDTWNGAIFTPGLLPQRPFTPAEQACIDFYKDPAIDALISAVPGSLTAAQRDAAIQKIAFALRAFMRVVRAEFTS